MVIERTCYQPKPGRLQDVLSTRFAACEVRVGLGLPPGEVFIDTAAERVHWECRFADQEEQAQDLAARDASPEFSAVRERMRALIDDFQRSVLRSASYPAAVLQDLPLNGRAVAPQELSFSSAGRELKGYLYLPPGPGPFPCLITNHGSSIHQGTSDICRPGVAAVLLSWGIASFLPHRHGYGNSPGTPWREEVSAEFGSEDYDRQLSQRLDAESDDVVAALDFVAALAQIDSKHIGVMGSSFGGTVTLLAAAKQPRFRCAVEFAGAAMNWERTPALRQLMLDAAAKLSQPIFFLQAANDYSARPTIELAASLEHTEKVVASKLYPAFGLSKDEGHFLYGQGPALWGADVRRFLERWL